jgi:TatA/E family protein of Tat protein translocase
MMNPFLLFFNISGGEILLIIIVIYLVFGPKKIPEFARMIGKGINEMRRATSDIRNEINREANKIKSDVGIDIDDPFKTERKSGTQNTTQPKSTVKTDKEDSSKEKPEKPVENKDDYTDLK